MTSSESNVLPSWKRPWTIKEIIDASKCWSLAADAGICELIKSLSTDLLTEIAQISNNINELSIESRETDVLIQNAFNDFCMLANDQFMENLVEEVSSSSLNNIGAKDTLETGSQSKENKMAQIVPQVTESIRLGLLVLDNQFEMLEVQKTTQGSFSLGQNDDVDAVDHSAGAVYDSGATGPATGYSEAIYQPRDPYEHRHLPHLIGTSDFVEDDTLGIGYLDDLDELKSVSIDDEDEDGDDEGRKRLQIGDDLSSSSDEVDPLSDSESDANKPVSMPTRPEPSQATRRRRSSSESIDLFATDKRRDSDLDDMFDTGVVSIAPVSIGNPTEAPMRPLTVQEAMHKQLQEKLGLTAKSGASTPVASPREARPPAGAGPDSPLTSSGERARPTALDKVNTAAPKVYSLFDEDEDDSSDNLFEEPSSSSKKRDPGRPAGPAAATRAPVAPAVGAALSSSISEATRQPLATRVAPLLASDDDDDDLFTNAAVSTGALARSMPGTATGTTATLAVPAMAATATSSPRPAAGAARKPVSTFLDTDSDDDDIFKPKPVSRQSNKPANEARAAAVASRGLHAPQKLQTGTRDARPAREPAPKPAQGKYPFSESDSDDIFEPPKARPLKPAADKPQEKLGDSPDLLKRAPIATKSAASPMTARPESPAARGARQEQSATAGRPPPAAARRPISSDSDDSIFGDYAKPIPPQMPSITKSTISKSEPDPIPAAPGHDHIHGDEAAPAPTIPPAQAGKQHVLDDDSDGSDPLFSPTARPAALVTKTVAKAANGSDGDATDPLSARPSTRKLPPGARDLFKSSGTTGASITDELVQRQHQRLSLSQAAEDDAGQKEPGRAAADSVDRVLEATAPPVASPLAAATMPTPVSAIPVALATAPLPAAIEPASATTQVAMTTAPPPAATVPTTMASVSTPAPTVPVVIATTSTQVAMETVPAPQKPAAAKRKISELQSRLALGPGGLPIMPGAAPPPRQAKSGHERAGGRDEPDDAGGEAAVSLDAPVQEVKQLVLLTKGRARNMPRRRPPTTGAAAAAHRAPDQPAADRDVVAPRAGVLSEQVDAAPAADKAAPPPSQSPPGVPQGPSAAPPTQVDPLSAGPDGQSQQPTEDVLAGELLESSDIFANLPARPDKKSRASGAATGKKQGVAKVPVNVSEIDDIFAVDTRAKKKVKAKQPSNDPLGANQ